MLATNPEGVCQQDITKVEHMACFPLGFVNRIRAEKGGIDNLTR
jgi:hypothetical protein